MQPLKRLINRLSGIGPNRVRPFATVVEARRDRSRGVHQPESFDGIVSHEAGDSVAYTEGRALLNQAQDGETIGGRRRYRSDGIVPQVEKCLFSLNSAGVIGADGLVYCPRTRLAVEETMRCWFVPNDQHPILAAPRTFSSRPVSGCTLNLAVLSAEGFYHFLFEALPRLWLARAQLADVDVVLANGAPGSFHEQWLAHASIETSRITWVQGQSHFFCEQLLFTNYLMADYQPTRWIRDAIRELLHGRPPARPGSRRLWISRADAKSRILRWEDELLTQLPGFEKITLSTMSPGEQIAIMHQAEIVAGPHGAGLSNIVFCAPGTQVVELFPDQNRQPIYSRIANVSDLPYAWAVVDFDEPTSCANVAAAIRHLVSELHR